MKVNRAIIGMVVSVAVLDVVLLVNAFCFPSIHRLVASGDIERLRARTWTPDELNTPEVGVTPLQLAASSGSPEAVQILLQQGADADRADDFGRTPIFIGVEKGNAEVVALLAAAGADVDAPERTGITPMRLAEEQGDRNIIQVLEAYTNDRYTSGTQRERN